MAGETQDKELEQFRNLLKTPDEFRDGFAWSTVAGIFFCGLIMLPGSIYLGLMTGGNLSSAATWVTVILFAEIAKRAMKTMSKQELVVLLHAASVMIAANVMFPGGPFGHFVFRAYLVTGEVVRDAGMTNSFPSWFVPGPDSDALLERSFFHSDWLIPVGLVFFLMIIGLIKKYTLGYFFFRLTSDVENLPFPLAPIKAQGILALSESTDDDDEEDSEGDDEESEGADEEADEETTLDVQKKGNKWRLFSLGASVGILFGALQVGVPAVTGLFLEQPIFLIPQPYIETTTLTEKLLPATPTGITFDIGIIILGFVLPFWSVVGTFVAILLTMILNPILHAHGVLTHWQPGMDTVNTTFANHIDFWLSFGTIGAGLGIAAISVVSTIRDVRAKIKAVKAEQQDLDAERPNMWAPPVAGRGDYPMWIALVAYTVAALAVVYVCHRLVPQLPISFLLIFSFVYNPFVSYVNARLLGIAGQSVEIPFVREGAFILSGAKGVDIWLAPVPIDNYGQQAESFRVNELTGVSFWSLIKADLIAVPVLFALSFLFWAFIWHSDAIPSAAFPYAEVNWELAAKNSVLLYSSTFVPPGEEAANVSIQDSEFWKAIKAPAVTAGFLFTVVSFVILSIFNLPVMLVYGFIRGLGQLPHFMILEIVGAMIGRYYFQKKFGANNFLRMGPTILAGYFTGVGLIGMATIAMKLIKEAISSAPF